MIKHSMSKAASKNLIDNLKQKPDPQTRLPSPTWADITVARMKECLRHGGLSDVECLDWCLERYPETPSGDRLLQTDLKSTRFNPLGLSISPTGQIRMF